MLYDSPGIDYDTLGIIYNQAALPAGADGGDTFGDYPAAVARARKRRPAPQPLLTLEEEDLVLLLALGALA